MAGGREYDSEKFRELLLHIAIQSEDDPDFGATKLNKIMFFADFLSYKLYDLSITGSMYQKLEHGPAPKNLLAEQDLLFSAGRAVVQTRDFDGYRQKRLIALDDASLKLFEPNEIDLVNGLVNEYQGFGATRISKLTHQVVMGWRAADLNQTIPYETVFVLSPSQPTLSQVKRAHELAFAK